MVVAENWANVKTVLVIEVPGEMCTGIFMYYDTVYNCFSGIGVLVKGDIEVSPS